MTYRHPWRNGHSISSLKNEKLLFILVPHLFAKGIRNRYKIKGDFTNPAGPSC